MASPDPGLTLGRVLGLIPARGGSKGIPRKNLAPLWGKSLLLHTAEAALAATRLDRVVLSTDDEEIAAAGRAAGLDVPFLRPAGLAADDTPAVAVVLHALDTLAEAGDTYGAVCLLQPTSPVRAPGEVDACIALLEASGADCVMTVAPVPPAFHPEWVYRATGDDGAVELHSGSREPPPRRQALPEALHRDGAVYVSRVDALRRTGRLYGDRVVGFRVPAGRPNIDGPADLVAAEGVMDRGT